MPLTFEAIESLGSDSQSIQSLLQDQQGYIWIGTIEGGLYRYDGRRAVKYLNDPADPGSLPAGRVAALHGDGHGRIWIGTDEGLARFEPDTNRFTRFHPDSAQRNTRIVRRIIGDGADGLWLGTWGGLQHFDTRTGQFQLHQADANRTDAISYNDVNAIALDASGGLWAATWPGGLSYLPRGARGFTHFRVDSDEQPDPKLNDVRTMRFDAGTKRLWMGTDAGVVVWQSGAPWSERRRLPGAKGRINSIDFDSHGNVWISTRTEGLLRWTQDLGQMQNYTHRAEDGHSVPSNAINTSLEDRAGTLWIGSFTNGVARANLGNYGLERIIPRDIAPESFPSSNFVRSMAAAPEGQLWLGVDDGLVLFDPAGKRMVRRYRANAAQPGALNHNSVYTLYQQGGGPLWVGTSKGLNRLDRPDGPFKSVRFDAPADNFVNIVAPARGGALWLGTGASLMRYTPADGAIQRYVHDPADPASRSVSEASAVLEDSQGRVWVGDFFRGAGLDLMVHPDGRFQHFRHSDNARSISSDKITSLYEDMYGTIWIGTARGLNRMVPGRDGTPEFQRYEGPGDPGPILIESIESDSSGVLWISTVRGLSRLDPSSGVFTHYSADDGLTDGLYQGSSARATDGKLYFGGTTGITAVYPELPLRAPTAPLAAITDIRIYDQSLSLGKRPDGVVLEGAASAPRALTLPWTVDVLTLEFAALHYAAPKRNTYTYRLEGFDQQWMQADADHPAATYTNLDPGHYRFRLRVTSNKGLNSEEITLPITVTPPFWQTWWFRAGTVLLVAVLVVTLYRMRVRSLTRRARRLEALVARRTQELEESNRKLTALSATDALTCLANRRSFDEALTREWGRAQRSGEPLALAMIDVDCFKLYNDSYGHQAGDACLREVARVLDAGVHRAADVAARYGGEEFAFIAPLNTAAQAVEMAEKIRADLYALALPHERSPSGRVTVSIGVAAIIPTDRQRPEMLVHAADQALYRAKEQGRNCVMQSSSEQPRRHTDNAAAYTAQIADRL